MNSHTVLHLLHIFVIGGFLSYIGIKKQSLSATWFKVILGVGVIVFAYHGYKYFGTSKGSWVNLFHMLIVAPLLMYTGYLGSSAPRYMFELILFTAFAAIGYHTFYLLE